MKPRETASSGFLMFRSNFYRWGMLAVILLLIGWISYQHLTRDPFNWREATKLLAVPSMLLVNHVAFAFEWPWMAGRIMIVIAYLWLTAGISLLVYL